MKKNYPYFLIILSLILHSCVSTKDVRYLQPSETLVINEEGLVPYNVPVYRVTKNDILTLNVVTTPKGDAAQFYSALNSSTSADGGGVPQNAVGNNVQGGQGGNSIFYFNGLKVDSKGDINIMGIGYVKAEGRTLEEITQEIQQRVNENFVEGKSEVRLNTDGITYYILGDVESVGLSGEIAKIDITREDAMNSPYYWVQNGDEILLTTRAKNLNGFGKDPIQTLTTGVSVITTALSIYLILTRL